MFINLCSPQGFQRGGWVWRCGKQTPQPMRETERETIERKKERERIIIGWFNFCVCCVCVCIYTHICVCISIYLYTNTNGVIPCVRSLHDKALRILIKMWWGKKIYFGSWDVWGPARGCGVNRAWSPQQGQLDTKSTWQTEINSQLLPCRSQAKYRRRACSSDTYHLFCFESRRNGRKVKCVNICLGFT